MTEADIQIVLGQTLLEKGHKFIVPNKMLHYEADLISINNSWFLHEYEIKISRSDFLREFKEKKTKHKLLKSGRATKDKPNYFWFACPSDLIDPNEIPEEYGLIYIENSRYKIIKRAKLLHRKKYDQVDSLTKFARSLSYKIFHRFSESLKTQKKEDPKSTSHQIKLYTGIDGIILSHHLGPDQPVIANHAKEYLRLITKHFDCYCISDQCKDDIQKLLQYLEPYADDELLDLLEQLQTTSFDTLKTENLEGDFILVQSELTSKEFHDLAKRELLDRWWEVNTHNNLDDLKDLITRLKDVCLEGKHNIYD